MTFTELEAMEKVATEIYNRGFEDGKKMEYKDFKFSEMQSESEKKEEISKDDAIKIVHDTIHDFFDDSETFTDKDELLLKINKAICNNIMGY